jgi:phosphinothricin acetyltransferase
MNLILRPSRDSDLPAITAIYGNSVLTETASWEYEAPDLAEMTRRRAEVLAKGFPYFVAEIDGNVVGYAYASSYRARIGYRFVVEDSVYVLNEMKGRGIGKKLLMALIEECGKRGYRQMVAVIGDSDNAGSIRLHEACGFTRAALFKSIGFKFDRWLDSVQMQRAL